MLTSPLDRIYFDRSRTAQDEGCPRSRYWGVEWGGVGLEPALGEEGKFYLPFGTAIHLGVELLAGGASGPDAAAGAWDNLQGALAGCEESYREEQKSLLYGMIAGYARSVWIDDLAEFDVVSVEDETEVTHGAATVVAKPDLVLRRKSDASLWYKEFKTTGWANEGWVLSWAHSAQLLTGALAVASRLKEPLAGSIIQGLFKGQKRGGKLSSIFCYANVLPDGEVSYEWKPRAQKVPVGELAGGREAWIANMPLSVLLEQFPSTPPIMFNAPLMDAWLEQKVMREGEIAAVRSLAPVDSDTLNKVFPMHIGTCRPQIGSPCPFLNLCYVPQCAESPLTMGFNFRRPHLTSDPAHAIIALINGDQKDGE